MNVEKKPVRWERTNVTNLWKLATSGSYYARVKVNGKEKWRSLKTKVFGVAKLRLADFEREERAKGARSAKAADQVEGGRCGKLLEITLADMRVSTNTKDSSKFRFETAAKALLKTWPDFLSTDVRRIIPLQCKQWARHAQTVGTQFIPPGAKPKNIPKGMSPSSFNQTLSVLRNVFAQAIRLGLIYNDPSEDIRRMTPAKKRLVLPTIAQFEKIVFCIANSHGHHSKDCADMVKLLATRCIESGVDIPTVSRWLGHADGGALAMRTYGHLRQEHSLEQAAKVTWKIRMAGSCDCLE